MILTLAKVKVRKPLFLSGIIIIFFLASVKLALGAVGPHGGYASTSDKCGSCHNMHLASGNGSLLAASNVYYTCILCHGVGGLADAEPYAHWPSLDAPSQHSPNETTSGSLSIGITPSLPKPLSCSSCHTPHGNPAVTVVAYSCDTSTTATSHLLRRAGIPTVTLGALPGPGATASLYYGNQWCRDCHNKAHDALVTNTIVHPYNIGSLTYINTGLARTHVNFSMYPVTTLGLFGTAATRTSPLCMQCHEDGRDVETAFNRSLPDWQGATKTNPMFATFPHQTSLVYFRIETGDDLCFNCHQTSSLP